MSENPPDDSYRNLPSAKVSFFGCSEDETEGRAIDQRRAELSARRRPMARLLANRVSIHVGDLTDQSVDAIVNAANPSLMGGGGVDGAIHRRAGPALAAACAFLRDTAYPDGLPTGEAVMTTGGNLPAELVIHTVGPVYGQHKGQEAALLAACYRNSLRLAQENRLRRVAFPAISTGIYGYPPAQAAKVVFATLQTILATENWFSDVRLVFLQREDAEIFLAAIGQPVD